MKIQRTNTNCSNFSRANKHKTKGFTILEVMVAMVILATAGIAIVQSASVHISSQSRLQALNYAQWVASNQLNQLLITKTWPIKDNQKGSVEMAGQSWHWQQNKLKTAYGDDLISVTISVYADDNYKEYITELTTYMSKP